MTTKRESLISLSDTPYYHCTVRCVRRAYLCGEDRISGQNFDHRRQWLVSRLRFLSYIYAVDICAYAVMSNHYHVVLHVDVKRAETWSDLEVVERWLQLYKGHVLVSRWLDDASSLTKAELKKVVEIISEWRERLTSISWFMRGVNETIAHMANEEDSVTGRFWEGRFKSQALLDMSAVLTCMAYVDLNPVRACMADDLIESDFTSIQQRLIDFSQAEKSNIDEDIKEVLEDKSRYQNSLKADQALEGLPEQGLMPLHGSSTVCIHDALPFTFADYLALVDATGRIIRDDKRGAIDGKKSRLIKQVNLDAESWLEQVQHFEARFGSCAGRELNMRRFSARFGRKWAKGVLAA